MTETNEEVVVDLDNEGEGESQPDTIAIPKSDYEKLNQTLGSLKRELKDLKKPKETQETPTNQKPDDALLQRVEKIALKSAGITHSDDVELARSIAKRTGKDIDEVLEDDYFKFQLEKQQTSRANVEATSGVKGGSGGSANKAKESTEYWQKLGQPPTPDEVPDSKTRRKIISEMLRATRHNKNLPFYNE